MHGIELASTMIVVRIEYTERGVAGVRLQNVSGNQGPSSRRGPTSKGAVSGAVKGPAWVDHLVREVARYLDGERPDFSKIPLDLALLTPLQQRILKKVAGIAYGRTRSYGQVSKSLGMAHHARSVGQACRANPVPVLIPCHRVVRSDGGVGGYSQGIEIKKQLLDLESRHCAARS